jgi:BASS family bile acid:Na+ symporter
MFRLNDLILLLVIFSSMLAGILLPRFAALFQPVTLYMMMLLLFLSFLSIRISTVYHTFTVSIGIITLLTVLKTIALPVAVYFLFRAVWPSYALAALLLSGISTGVVAPFISNLVGGNSPLVLVMVVITSLLAPFSLPSLVKILWGRSIEISLFEMIRMLSMVVFVPILAVETVRRLKPSLISIIVKRQFPITLLIFFIINLGVFSRYAEFFYQKPITILTALVVAVILSGIYFSVGILVFARGGVENKLAAAISLGNMNNVLTVVFASQFFGPLEPTVAALYQVPFFGLIVPLRFYRSWRQDQKQSED